MICKPQRGDLHNPQSHDLLGSPTFFSHNQTTGMSLPFMHPTIGLHIFGNGYIRKHFSLFPFPAPNHYSDPPSLNNATMYLCVTCAILQNVPPSLNCFASLKGYLCHVVWMARCQQHCSFREVVGERGHRLRSTCEFLSPLGTAWQ